MYLTQLHFLGLIGSLSHHTSEAQTVRWCQQGLPEFTPTLKRHADSLEAPVFFGTRRMAVTASSSGDNHWHILSDDTDTCVL